MLASLRSPTNSQLFFLYMCLCLYPWRYGWLMFGCLPEWQGITDFCLYARVTVFWITCFLYWHGRFSLFSFIVMFTIPFSCTENLEHTPTFRHTCLWGLLLSYFPHYVLLYTFHIFLIPFSHPRNLWASIYMFIFFELQCSRITFCRFGTILALDIQGTMRGM